MLDSKNLEFMKASSTDAPAIERLYNQFIDDINIVVTPESINSIRSDQNQNLLVVKYGDQVIGTAFVVLARDVMYRGQPFAVVENIVIDSDFQGNGVGKQLMNSIKIFCRERQCTKIMLLSSSKRSRAHKFFEDCGYQSDLKKGFVNYINRI